MQHFMAMQQPKSMRVLPQYVLDCLDLLGPAPDAHDCLHLHPDSPVSALAGLINDRSYIHSIVHYAMPAIYSRHLERRPCPDTCSKTESLRMHVVDAWTAMVYRPNTYSHGPLAPFPNRKYNRLLIVLALLVLPTSFRHALAIVYACQQMHCIAQPTLWYSLHSTVQRNNAQPSHPLLILTPVTVHLQMNASCTICHHKWQIVLGQHHFSTKQKLNAQNGNLMLAVSLEGNLKCAACSRPRTT